LQIADISTWDIFASASTCSHIDACDQRRRTSEGGHASREIAGMISLETLVWLAPLLAAVVVVLTGLVDIWLTDRAERRRGRQSAHEQA
jgi:hypothetical protein